MSLVYLDYAATTPVDPRVADAMDIAQRGQFANASALHPAGRESERAVEKAAGQVAALLGCAAGDVLWTSGATEADNLAVLGTAAWRERHGRHVISMQTEHKAVTDAFRELERRGYDVTWLEPGRDGLVTAGQLEEALRDDTQLVSIMHVNNETGVVQDIASLGEVCRRHGVVFHVDAAQSAGKLPIDLPALPIDLVSISGHKMYGPKGIGALIVQRRPGVNLSPLLFGGGQQQGLRPGTLPVPLIIGLGEAAAVAAERIEADLEHARHLCERLWASLADIPGCTRNGDADSHYPGILNVSVSGVEGESLLLALEPVCVATGSACNSRDREPSTVLRALGLSDREAQSAIRFSFGRFTSEGDIDEAARRYRVAVDQLRQAAPR